MLLESDFVPEVGLAEAIFANTAEWPDELAFDRGELLRVLDSNPGASGTEGWWLCANKLGRRGIAPANRLRLIHSFTPSKSTVSGRSESSTTTTSRVVTPRRIGDVFMYNPTGDSLFADGELEEFFGIKNGLNATLPGTYASPQPSSSVRFRSESPLLRDMRLFHSADRPIVMLDRQSTRPSQVRNVPIRLESNGVKKPPPPPPVRRQFGANLNLTSTSDVDYQPTYDSPGRYSNTQSAGTYQSPVALRTATVAPPPAPPVLSPLSSSSDRSSSLSEDSTRSSNQSFYDVPPTSKLSTTTTTAAEKSASNDNEHDSLTSVLLNVLEELHVYDSPKSLSTGITTSRRDLQSSLRDVLNRSSDSGNLTDSSDGGSLTPVNTVSQRQPAPYSYTRENLPTNSSFTPTNGTSMRDNLPTNGPSMRENLHSGSNGATTSTSSSTETLKNSNSNSNGRRTVTFAPQSAYETYDVPPATLMSTATKSSPISSALKKPSPPATTAVVTNSDELKVDNNFMLDSYNFKVDSDRVSLSSLDSKDSDYQQMLSEGSQGEPIGLSQTAANAALQQYQSAVQLAVAKLCAFVTRHWRKREILQPHLADIKASCTRVCSDLADFVQFCLGAFINCSRIASDLRLAKQLAQMLRPLRNSMRLLESTIEQLNKCQWDLNTLIRDANSGGDPLDRFVAVAKEIPEDCRQVATFIQSNSTLIFAPPGDLSNSFNLAPSESNFNGKLAPSGEVQSRPLPPPPSGLNLRSEGDLTPTVERHAVMESDYETDVEASLFDDYDFIEVPNGQHQHANLNKFASSRNGDANWSDLSSDDRQILNFYSPQLDSHMSCLSEAIDKFLSTIEANRPPKDFVADSKFVILAAHKLVYMGDSVAQCVKLPPFSNRIRIGADSLCGALRHAVMSTKQAAIQFPAVPPVQLMVDSMVAVSHAAQDLRLLIQTAADR